MTHRSPSDEASLEQPIASHRMRERCRPYRMYIAFWILGLLNNFLWVTMNAGANSINKAGIGMVYLANVVPSLTMKLTGPYWFHFVSYRVRMVWMALLMVLSLGTVAWGESPYLKLVGVAFCSVACGMGEASLLAMASFYDAQVCLSAWSSGTGFSGIAGYLWSLTFDGLDICFQVQLMVALWIPVAWLFTFFVLLGVPWIDKVRHQARCAESEETQDLDCHGPPGRRWVATASLSVKERFHFTLRLWPYTVPLFWVYAAEYLIQSGFWAAMGFPITDPISRRHWYKWSNFTYQIGVFVSRTFFLCLCNSRKVLWLGGLLQVLLCVFFAAAALMPFGHWWLLFPALCVGFLGGGVYVGAFTLLAQEQPSAYVELALSSASVADTFGMILASSLGFMVQGCIFGVMKVLDTAPDFTCGFDFWDTENSTVSAPSFAKYCFPGVQG
ncbi:Protein BTN1 [Durusdinium trenchii]|uniref:Protein BTN1 n=1 Tax=Durusdinium trenchii TaxID=1381693 RepID=A0ABP0J2S8_9DINO